MTAIDRHSDAPGRLTALDRLLPLWIGITMVLICNDLACGDRELAAVLVALNSEYRILAFSLLGWFYLTFVPSLLGLDTSGIDVTARQLTHSVLIFLGIPLLAGLLTRVVVERSKGADWYEQRFIPSIALSRFTVYCSPLECGWDFRT